MLLHFLVRNGGQFLLRILSIGTCLLLQVSALSAQGLPPNQLKELDQLVQQSRAMPAAGRSTASLGSRSYLFQHQKLLSPELSARRSDIRTFSIQSKSTRKSIGYVVLTDQDGIIYLEQGQNSWVVHTPQGQPIRSEPSRSIGNLPVCQFERVKSAIPEPQEKSGPNRDAPLGPLFSYGTQLRKYRLAIVATYEYFSFFPDYQSAELELIASVMNVSRTYRKEFSVDFELSAYFIHTNENDGIDPSSDILLEAQQAVTAQFDVADFDLGHVFHQQAAGGAANGGVVCIDDWKARAWTANVDARVTNVFWTQTLLHEFGHQFSASHTMDGTAGSCGVGRVGHAAYEPMSGSTIMSYFGGCLQQNVSLPEAKGFHVHSRQEVFNFTHFGLGNACPTLSSTGHTPPVVDADPLGLEMATIPLNTPFILTGSGYDQDGETVLYSWEQYDKTEVLIPATATVPNAGDPNAPLFRTYFATEEPVRVFPRMERVLQNDWPNVDEALPIVGRTMNFRLTAKDLNENGGGVAVDGLTITVDGNSGPFVVLTPNGEEDLVAGTSTRITWDPAGTSAYSPIVDILLSTDGGASFPFILLEDTPNDGEANVLIPENVQAADQARLMVISGLTSSLQFFDVSDKDLSITSNCELNALGRIGGPQHTLADNQTSRVDLDLNYLGFPLNSYTFDIPDNGSGTRALMTGYNEERTACETRFEEDYEDIFLQVDREGPYLIQIPDGGQCHGYITLFDEALFDENDPCAGFLNSNGFGGFWYCDFTAQLEPGKQYRLRVYDVLGNLGEVIFMPREGGNVFLSDPAQVPPLNWVAVDQESKKIIAYSTTAGFSNLAPGQYLIYGIRFASAIDPNDILGKTLSDLHEAAFCVEWTDNYKLLEIRDVLGACQEDTIAIEDFTTLSVDTLRAGQIITANAAVAPGRNIFLQAGEQIVLQPGFSSSGPLTGKIEACEAAISGDYVNSGVLQFDGVDDEVSSTGSTVLYCSDFTIETWVRMDELPVFDGGFFVEIGDLGPDKWLWFTGVDENGFGSIITGFRNGGTFQDFAFGFVPKVGEWVHLVATYSDASAKMSFYINGYLQDSQTAAISPGNEGMPRIRLGRQISGGIANHFFSGALEEVRIWEQCRSGNDIRAYMHRELVGNEAGLLAYYSFNSLPTACIDVFDCSTNELHGNRIGTEGLYNLPQYEEVRGPLKYLSADCNASPGPCNSTLFNQDLPEIKNDPAVLDIRLYPNPASTFFQLDYQLTEDRPVRISLYDLSGNWLQDLINEEKAIGLYQEVYADFSLTSGVYLIRFQTPEASTVKRLVWIASP